MRWDVWFVSDIEHNHRAAGAGGEGVKTCQSCAVTKPRADFWSDSVTEDGLKSFCILCGLAYQEAFYDPNPAKRRAFNRQMELNDD